MNDLCYNMSSGNGCPLRKGGIPMQYVTYKDFIQNGLVIVALIGLIYEICHHNDKK